MLVELGLFETFSPPPGMTPVVNHRKHRFRSLSTALAALERIESVSSLRNERRDRVRRTLFPSTRRTSHPPCPKQTLTANLWNLWVILCMGCYTCDERSSEIKSEKDNRILTSSSLCLNAGSKTRLCLPGPTIADVVVLELELPCTYCAPITMVTARRKRTTQCWPNLSHVATLSINP